MVWALKRRFLTLGEGFGEVLCGKSNYRISRKILGKKRRGGSRGTRKLERKVFMKKNLVNGYHRNFERGFLGRMREKTPKQGESVCCGSEFPKGGRGGVENEMEVRGKQGFKVFKHSVQ